MSMSAQVLTDTRNMTHIEWLDSRRKGIGGSDVAAIAGLNPWKSPMRVFLEKTGQVLDDEAGEAAYWGTKLEAIVAEEFAERTGLKVRRRNAILQHPGYPWMLANVDRLIIGQNVGLEVKTASAYKTGDWEQDSLPDQYMLQIQHYMAVTGYKQWWIAVLIGGNKFMSKLVERDEDIIRYLIQIESDFWNNHVIPNVPPAFDGSQDATDLLRSKYPVGRPTVIDLPSDAEWLIKQYEVAAEDEKEAKDRKEAAANQLKSLLGENETGLVNGRQVTWKRFEASRFDSKSLQADMPDVYGKYLKKSESQRFAIK